MELELTAGASASNFLRRTAWGVCHGKRQAKSCAGREIGMQ